MVNSISTANCTCFANLYFVRDSSIEINVVRSDTGSDTELEVLGLSDEVCGEVARVEWSSYQDFTLR
jgi:hypothetical protein